MWRSIDTAPKDGSDFDGWGYCIPDSAEMPREPKLRRYTECFWGERSSHYVRKSKQPHMGQDGWCWEGRDGWSWAMVLTHWMPVPGSPNDSTDDLSEDLYQAERAFIQAHT